MDATRLPMVCVIGSGSDAHEPLASEVGNLIARLGVHLLTGGGRGVMAAVSKAFLACPERKGMSIGVLPSNPGDVTQPKAGYPNDWIEIPIRTHLPLSGDQGTDPMSRNHVSILSANAVVALPGEAGTASECGLAIRYDRPILAYLGPMGSIPDLSPEIEKAQSIEDVERFLRTSLLID